MNNTLNKQQTHKINQAIGREIKKQLPDQIEINNIKYKRGTTGGIKFQILKSDGIALHLHLQRYKANKGSFEVELEIPVKFNIKSNSAVFDLSEIKKITFLKNILIQTLTNKILKIGQYNYLINSKKELELKTKNQLVVLAELPEKKTSLIVKTTPAKQNSAPPIKPETNKGTNLLEKKSEMVKRFEPNNDLNDITKAHFLEAQKIYFVNPRWCVPIFRVILEINLNDYFKDFEQNPVERTGKNSLQLSNYWCNNGVDKSVIASQTPYYIPDLKAQLILLRDFCNNAAHASKELENNEEYIIKVANMFEIIHDLCQFLNNTKKMGEMICKKIKEVDFK